MCAIRNEITGKMCIIKTYTAQKEGAKIKRNLCAQSTQNWFILWNIIMISLSMCTDCLYRDFYCIRFTFDVKVFYSLYQPSVDNSISYIYLFVCLYRSINDFCLLWSVCFVEGVKNVNQGPLHKFTALTIWRTFSSSRICSSANVISQFKNWFSSLIKSYSFCKFSWSLDSFSSCNNNKTKNC